MEAFFASLAFYMGNSPVTGEFPTQKTSDAKNVSIRKDSDAELWCFLSSAYEQTVEQTIETPVIWGDIALIMSSL